MATIQERLQFKRSQIDTWSTREKLVLASAVVRSGDQNWMSVSRVLKPFAEPGCPSDWFSQKNCAVQYAALLENAEMPKRKKRCSSTSEKKDFSDETPGQSIVRMLTQERIEELHRRMAEEKAKYLALKDDIMLIESGRGDDKLDQWTQEIENDKKQKIIDAENHAIWLKEREEKKAQLERAWKPPMLVASPLLKRKLPPQHDYRRNSSQSEQSSEAESAVNSPLNEPLNVDTMGEEAPETKPTIPVPTPTSPLLTSLLKTPSPATAPTTPQTSSILHSAITSSQRDSSPTIASLLSSSPGVPTAKPDVQAQTQVQPPSAGAPTLSMLLELPASVPGKPLPELPTVVPPPKTEPTTITTTTQPEDLHHPQHQEMRVRKETETDEILEVVELEQQSESEDRSNPIEIGLEEIIANLEAAENVRDDLLQEEIVLMDATPSDSSTLFDSFLKSMDNVKEKSSTSAQLSTPSQNLSTEVASIITATEVNVAEIKAEHKKDEMIPAPSLSVLSSIEEANSIIEENTKLMKEGLKEESAKTEADTLADDLNMLLETSDLQSELIETVGGQADISSEEFDAQSLAEMEVIIMDKVQELEEQEMKKSEMDQATRSAILEIVLGSESASADMEDKTQHTKPDLDVSSKPEAGVAPQLVIKNDVVEEVEKPVSKKPEEPKVFDKFDEMVNEGLPKRKEVKTKEPIPRAVKTPTVKTPTIEEVIVEKPAEDNNAKSVEVEGIATAQEPQVSDEPKIEKPSKPPDEIKAEEDVEVKKSGVQEETPHVVAKDVDEDKSAVSSQESTDETEEVQYPEASRSKQEVVRAETPLTETSDAEQPLGSSIRSYGRHTVTPALDSVPNSPASVLTEDEREYRAWKKAIMLVWSRIASHKFASLFLKPITDDQAPLYSVRVKKPIDLMTIKRSIETGATRTTIDFQRDTLLMFLNAQMYNNCLHRVYNMAKEMQEDSMLLIRDFVETQKLVQSAGEVTALRRETRTTDAMKRDDSDGPRTPLSFKRKRVSDLEKTAGIKKVKLGP